MPSNGDFPPVSGTVNLSDVPPSSMSKVLDIRALAPQADASRSEGRVAWCQLRSGTPFDFLKPNPKTIRLRDISICLSRIPRFNGHTTNPGALVGAPYCVAQHSILVRDLLPKGTPPITQLLALMHDAHEYVVGDITTPVQMALAFIIQRETGRICDPIPILKATVQAAILKALGVPDGVFADSAIDQADRLALAVEKRDFMAQADRPWMPLPNVDHVSPQITWPPPRARSEFTLSVMEMIGLAGVDPLPGFLE